MRAAWYERQGPAREVLQVGTLPDPIPGLGEVLVRLRASGVNPHDTKKRAGWNGLKMPFARIVPHFDGAGEIVDVGPGGAFDRIGQRVWVYGGAPDRPFGTAAELIATPVERAVPLDDGVDAAVGACFGVAACTAHDAVFSDGPVAGQTILVQAGAGAVSHFAVQFAKHAGARVIATVSSPEKAAHATAGGAEHVVDYKREDVVARVRELTGGAGVDRIVEVDFGANLKIDAALIKNHGVIASYSSTAVPEPALPYYAFAFKGVTLRFVQGQLLTKASRHAAAGAIRAALRQGWLKATIARRFPLAEIAAAHECQESGTAIGKVIVDTA
ncbi:MAG: NADPH:quinone reductase [Proteobacteria bacterium]|nr:NADPH:quinone reductase [Pseudomonadota bacterium]